MARQQTYRGIRTRSARIVLRLPFFDVAIGGAKDKGEIRGHAHSIVAISDITGAGGALGFIAVGRFTIGYYAAGEQLTANT